MHHLDLGLFNYQITFTYDLLKQSYGASILDKVDKRLVNIPRFLELKIFKNGIQSLSRITANEYRNLMKIIIFVLDNLDISEALNKKLLNLYKVWNNMYIMSQSEEFDDQSLKDFEIIQNISNLFKFIYQYFNILIN